ncbi:hypothetical protein BGX24_003538, partial [Mortierella sp. AD032]
MLAFDTPVIERIPNVPLKKPPTNNKPLKPATARSVVKADRPQNWTLEYNSLLIQFVGQDYPWRWISDIIGRSLPGCRRHYNKYLAPFSIVPQTATTGSGAFSDLSLIKKRVQETKNWRQIAEELGQPVKDLQARYYVLEPWLREGMGHRSSAVRRQMLSGFAKNVDDVFEAMIKDESGLSLETVQGWYDSVLVGYRKTRALDLRQQKKEAPLSTSTWTKEMDARLLSMKREGTSWMAIEAEFGMRYEDCLKRLHFVRDMGSIKWNRSASSSGMRHETPRQVVSEVKSRLNEHGRIERYYTGKDWAQLLGLTSRTSSVENWWRLQLEWLDRNPAWSDRAENLLIQQVVRKGLSAWEDIAATLNMNMRRDITDKTNKLRIVTPAECRIRWKNLDMPVQRAFDSREWTPSTRQAFWLAWSRRHKEHKNEIMGSSEGDHDFWDRVATDMRMPGGGEQCVVFFEDSIRGLTALDDKTISNHAARQAHDAQEKSRRQAIILRPKHWSLVLQDLIRKNDIKPGPYTKTPGLEVGWKAIVEQIRDYERSSQQWSLDEDLDKTTFNGIQWHWRRISKESGPPWSHSELKLLERGIRECGYRWRNIWQKYLPWRTSTMMRPRWYLLPDCAARITVDEYVTLLQAVDEQQPQAKSGSLSVEDIDWSKVAARMPGWSEDPCRRAFESSFRFLMEQTKFTTEEDQWLLENIVSQEDQSLNWNEAVDRFPES